jgi:hypothetical protein
MNELITDTIAIGVEDNKVTLKFEKPIQYARFDDEIAKNIGMEIAKLAYELKTGQKAEMHNAGGKILTAQLEEILLNRLTHVIRNLSEKGKQPGFIAAECLNIVLREVY